MKYDIYFHNDFDGRAASAVMLAFLRSRGDDIEHFVPVKYDIIPRWLDENFLMKHKLFKGKHNPAIIVDFPFHPQATFWFDHHLTPFRKPTWQKKFKTTKFLHYDDIYKSACHLVYESLKNDFGWKPPAYLKELVAWLNIIDFANYKNPKQTIELKEPGIQVNNFIEANVDNQKITEWTVKSLASESVADFARKPKVKATIVAIKKEIRKAMQAYTDYAAVDGEVVVMDLSLMHAKVGDADRFIPYVLYPKIMYAIRHHPFPGKASMIHINVAANPWRREDNEKNIGELLRKYGGGGHKDVGGIEFPTKKKALAAIDEFVAFLNK